jgi:CMP-N-acetylneuraminic acid synthetase
LNILVVVPARGGSKGIPLKNIYSLDGKPLIEYTLDMLLDVDVNIDISVSTDSAQVKEVVAKYNDIFIIDRPENISKDTSLTEDTLIHALEYMEKKYSNTYDYVLTVQPTSPLRKSSTFVSFLEEFNNVCNTYDAQLTLTESYSDYWIKDGKNTFQRLYPNAPRRRQERKPIYVENSSLYITSVASLKETKSVLGNNAHGYIISAIEAIDINEYIDLDIAETFLRKTSNTEECV